MYNNYKLVILTLNTKGGEAQTIEAMTKEVDGKIVPCTEDEAILKMLSKVSTTGGNNATQSIKGILLNPDGEVVKTEEIKKPKVEAPKAETTKAEAPTEE